MVQPTFAMSARAAGAMQGVQMLDATVAVARAVYRFKLRSGLPEDLEIESLLERRSVHDDYELERKPSSYGGFGVVQFGYHKRNGHRVAVKLVRRLHDGHDTKREAALKREMEIGLKVRLGCVA